MPLSKNPTLFHAPSKAERTPTLFHFQNNIAFRIALVLGALFVAQPGCYKSPYHEHPEVIDATADEEKRFNNECKISKITDRDNPLWGIKEDRNLDQIANGCFPSLEKWICDRGRGGFQSNTFQRSHNDEAIQAALEEHDTICPGVEILKKALQDDHRYSHHLRKLPPSTSSPKNSP